MSGNTCNTEQFISSALSCTTPSTGQRVTPRVSSYRLPMAAALQQQGPWTRHTGRAGEHEHPGCALAIQAQDKQEAPLSGGGQSNGIRPASARPRQSHECYQVPKWRVRVRPRFPAPTRQARANEAPLTGLALKTRSTSPYGRRRRQNHTDDEPYISGAGVATAAHKARTPSLLLDSNFIH